MRRIYVFSLNYDVGLSNNYENWINEHKNLDCEEAAYDAASKICLKYEIPDDKEAQAQKRGKTAKKVYKIMTSQ